MEAMRHAIAEALSNSEVAERIWALEPNRFCADCGSPQPDWASINLCVVICKRCAGNAPPLSTPGCCVRPGTRPLSKGHPASGRGGSPKPPLLGPWCSAGGFGGRGARLCAPPDPKGGS